MIAALYIFFLTANNLVIGTSNTLEQCITLLHKTEKEFEEDKLPIPVLKCVTGFPEKGFKQPPTSEGQNAIEKRKV